MKTEEISNAIDTHRIAADPRVGALAVNAAQAALTILSEAGSSANDKGLSLVNTLGRHMMQVRADALKEAANTILNLR